MRPDVARSARSCFPPSCWLGIALGRGQPPETPVALDSAVASLGPPYRVLAPFRCPLKARHGCPGHSPGLSPPSGPSRGWRDRCRSQGLGPSGRRSWQPMRAVAPANTIPRLTSSLVNSSEVMCQKLSIAGLPADSPSRKRRGFRSTSGGICMVLAIGEHSPALMHAPTIATIALFLHMASAEPDAARAGKRRGAA